MASIKLWPSWDFDQGVATAQLKSWAGIHGFVERLLDLPHYIFRGQRRDDWLLESTLTRDLRKRNHPEATVDNHLRNFRYAARGRRGPNPPKDILDEQMWALGQHHALFCLREIGSTYRHTLSHDLRTQCKESQRDQPRLSERSIRGWPYRVLQSSIRRKRPFGQPSRIFYQAPLSAGPGILGEEQFLGL
jgi:hypothetical protein